MVGPGLSKRKQVTRGSADLSWLEQVQASPVGGSGAAHLYVFYVSWRFWEAHLYVFYVSWRLWEAHLYVFSSLGGPGVVPPLTKLWRRVSPLPKHLRPEASETLRLAEARVLRVLEDLGGSFVCVLPVGEALGASDV